MTDDKARRREVANRIHVKASPGCMSTKEFTESFLDEHVILNRDIVETTTQTMFCDACATDAGNGARLMHQLHVSIGEDPLRNYWKLATLKCFGCGFEEIVPLDMPNFGDFETPDKRDVWEQEREKFWQERKRREEAKITAARQAQLAQMAQVAGVQGLQNQTATAIRLQQEAAAQKMEGLMGGFDAHMEEMLNRVDQMVKQGTPPPQPLLDTIRKRMFGKKT